MDQRYKQRSLQFNSSADSRALRAINYQERQRSKRCNVVSQRRQMDNLQDSLDTERLTRCRTLLAVASGDTQPCKTQEELGRERYQELLKWKDEKKKKLLMEKKRRKPSFRTGLYQPVQPKYLVSADSCQLKPETPSKNTPFKHSKMFSTEKKKVPIFRPGGTPSSALVRVPQFHTGITPSVTAKSSRQCKAARGLENFDSASKKLGASKKLLQADPDAGRSASSRVRVTRHRKVGMSDLGVKPLPITPQAAQAFTPTKTKRRTNEMQTSQLSFAPDNFAFNFEFPKNPTTSLESVAPCVVPDDDDILREETHEELANEKGHTEYDDEDLREDKDETAVPDEDNASEDLDKTSLVNVTPVEEVLEAFPDEGGQIEPKEEDEEEMKGEKDENSKLQRKSYAVTPRKRITRRISTCCYNELVTPFASRLRPRTPCSRSTRRSQSAHCDIPAEFYSRVPTSARKNIRKSMTSSVKKRVSEMQTENHRQDSSEGGDCNNKMDDEITVTPVSSGQDVKFWKLEASPWIDNCRRSAKKKCATPDFQKLPDLIPNDGSPLPAPHVLQPISPYHEEAPATVFTPKDNACINLDAFLVPSALEDTISPKIDVWGSDSPSLKLSPDPDTTIQTKPCTTRQSQSAIVVVPTSPKNSAGKENSPPALSTGKKRGSRRSSRRSVMFAVEEMKNETPCVRIPGTPVSMSTRISMGTFAKAEVNEDQMPSLSRDLLNTDSSVSDRETKAMKGRKSGIMSSRVSLLPVLPLSPTTVRESPITHDLISWDSPALPTQVGMLKTPVRRSRRLSKLPIV
ncbi:hypothetical protein Pmani_014493 [Petrolisthes manimaculis]|uniref:Uncharacterized protein n=1 Tax=Petrolisthes manimaculis TaxID=1843537 RepID=A0AAE1PWE3_9EUCA|nr:hypothetical protein Pmani_014493 [Petrolisthes manimaculis]